MWGRIVRIINSFLFNNLQKSRLKSTILALENLLPENKVLFLCSEWFLGICLMQDYSPFPLAQVSSSLALMDGFLCEQEAQKCQSLPWRLWWECSGLGSTCKHLCCTPAVSVCPHCFGSLPPLSHRIRRSHWLHSLPPGSRCFPHLLCLLDPGFVPAEGSSEQDIGIKLGKMHQQLRINCVMVK